MNVALPYDWVPRNYQMRAWRHFEGPGEGKRGVCVWHRRAGKDLFAINLCAVKAHERVGTYWHLLPTYKQGRKIVWNGFTRDSRKFLSHFPKELVDSPNATEMRVTFKNGSIYEVIGTDNVDSLVGTNPVGCVFSEYSLQDPRAWDLVRPILAENGGWALFIYTARGKNHGHKLLEMAKKNPKWFWEVLVAGDQGTTRPDGTPVISDTIIQDERDAGMPEELVQQEFFCSFEAPLVGSYYGSQMMLALKQGRITKVPHEPRLPVHTYWDIGMDDSTTIWFHQTIGKEHRFIDYYEASGEGLPHYARVLRGQVDNGEHRREYVYGEHWGPHDIQVREFGPGESRIEQARKLGIKFKVVPVAHDIQDGIEAVRLILASCWFDETRCERGIEALRNYRKEWDEENKIFRGTPLHDWSSHGADGFRTFAMSGRARLRADRRELSTTADDPTYRYI